MKEGIKAGLGRIYGPTVQVEISINDQSGGVDILVLRRVVEDVQDSSSEISLNEARWDDEGFEIGDFISEFKIENLDRPNKSIVYPFALLTLFIFGYLNYKRKKISKYE